MLQWTSKAKMKATQGESLEGQRLRRLADNVKKLYVIQMASSIHFFGSVMILFFQDWGGINFGQIMLLESVFTGGIFAFELPTGVIADKVSRKLSLVLSYLINTLAILLYVSYANFWVFAAGELVWAIAVSLNSGAFDALLYDSLVELGQESRSKKIMARMQSLGLAAMVAGSVSGGLIAKYWGLKATMTLSAIPLIIAFGLSLSLEEPRVHQASHQDSPWAIFKKGCDNIRRNKSLQRLIVDTVVISVIAYYILWIWQERMLALGVGVHWFGFIHSGMILAQILLLNMFRPLERWFARKEWDRGKLAVVKLTSIGTGVGFLLAGLSDARWAVVGGTLVAAGFGLSRRTLLTNYMQKHIASGQRATTISTVSMVRMFLLLCLNPLLGLAVEWNMKATLAVLGSLALAWGAFGRLSEKDLHD